tara:strand:- start:176 stop:397 length:222 start_codon:yes stop_codon:yes gene_type:complete
VVTQSKISYECGTERDIFDLMGLEYKEPWQRGVYAAAAVTTQMGEEGKIDLELLRELGIHSDHGVSLSLDLNG